MRFASAILCAALPALANAANFVTGNRISEDTFKYEIEKCTDAKPCSLYLVRLSDMKRVATIFERKAGTEFTAKIQNVPSATYIFQATGGEDGKTAVTTQFTYHADSVITNTGTVTSTSPTESLTMSPPMSSSGTTSSTAVYTTASSHPGSTGTSTGLGTGGSTRTSTGSSTGSPTGSSTHTSKGASTATSDATPTGSMTGSSAVESSRTSETSTGNSTGS
ncbi:phosphoinositide 3-kinase [Metarhizium rileyi]|uniref:Phosphoinositide 3-kinase n=1 Tax=Metarhizium rileyi (strain RCEF 4871) TaxID=1649241 RepID=A0A167I1Z1_METRR|nr:phosphoinositide 3-kinase [Metarhizium rileyi RCEF 4871]